MTCVCGCGPEHHLQALPRPCLKCLGCGAYEFATPDNPVRPDWQKYVDGMRFARDRVRCVLDAEPALRNMTNTQFALWFRGNVDGKAEVETIVRVRRALVADNPGRYGPTDPSLADERRLKQLGIEEWATTD